MTQRFRSPLGSEEPDDLLLRHGDWLLFAVQTVVTSWLRTGTYINFEDIFEVKMLWKKPWK